MKCVTHRSLRESVEDPLRYKGPGSDGPVSLLLVWLILLNTTQVRDTQLRRTVHLRADYHTHTHTHSSSLLSRRSHHFTICRNHVISVLVVLLCDSNHSRIRTTSTKNHDSQTWVCATFHWVSSPETWTFHGMLNEIRRCCLDITSGAQHALILQLALALALVFNLWRPVFGRSRQLLKVNYRCEVAVYLKQTPGIFREVRWAQ